MYAKLFSDLFSTDYGIMSILVILFTLVMAGYFSMLFMNKLKNSAPSEPPHETAKN